MADLESHLDGDLITSCLKEMKEYLPLKRKLTKENVQISGVTKCIPNITYFIIEM